MSSCVGDSGVNGSSKVGVCGTEDPSKANSNETYVQCFKAVRPRVDNADSAGEGRSSGVGQLVRSALPGRKAHKKTCTEDNRGRWREGQQERDEEYVGNIEGRERGRQRQRNTERTVTHEEEAQNRRGRGSIKYLSRKTSDLQSNSNLEVGEESNNLLREQMCPRAQSMPPQPPVKSRSTPLSPRRLTSRTSARDMHCDSSRQSDPFWVKVRAEAAAAQSSQRHHTQTLTTSEPEDEEEQEDQENEEEEQQGVEDVEGGSGLMEVMSQTTTPALMLPCLPFVERKMTKRDKNRSRCLRRRQRRRESWRQSEQDSRQSSTGNPSSSSEDEEDVGARDRDGYICAVCLDVYFSPYMCHPCNHIFCEPCLRTLAKNSPTNTPCPLCRTVITHVFFQKELNQTARTFFPKEYLSRKQNFQKATCAKWPLPSCRKLFHIFGGFQRQSGPIVRRQFPHRGDYRMNAMDFEENSRWWRFDMDMVIIYIYSVNWVIGFLIICFLCYLFLPSF